jgi:hypothetical protein
MNMNAEPAVDAGMAMKVELPPIYSQPQLLVAPVVNESKSAGYIFSNISLEMNADVKAKSKVPLEMVMQDAYLSLIVGNPKFNFPHTAQFEFLEFKSGLKARINESVGVDLVRSIYVSGVNFLGRGEARTKQTLQSVWLQKQDDNTPAPAPKNKDDKTE